MQIFSPVPMDEPTGPRDLQVSSGKWHAFIRDEPDIIVHLDEVSGELYCTRQEAEGACLMPQCFGADPDK